jgi:hypothetical protein
MFKVRQRAVIAQAPEGFNNYNEGDEVIVETTFEDGFSHARIVGPAAPKTPSPEAFRPLDAFVLREAAATSGGAHLDAAFSAAGVGLANHVRMGDRINLKNLTRIVEEANYSLRRKGLVLKPDYKMHGATEFVVEKLKPEGSL